MYLTLLLKPLPKDLEYFSHIEDSDRREYLAALYRMDYKVGELVSKLKETDEFENTIIVYTSDNVDGFDTRDPSPAWVLPRYYAILCHA